jgi:hypothetical protein
MKYSATTSSAGNNNSRFGNMTRANKVTQSNSVICFRIFSSWEFFQRWIYYITYHPLGRHNQRPALALDRVTIAFVATGETIPRRMGDSTL